MLIFAESASAILSWPSRRSPTLCGRAIAPLYRLVRLVKLVSIFKVNGSNAHGFRTVRLQPISCFFTECIKIHFRFLAVMGVLWQEIRPTPVSLRLKAVG